MSIAFLILIWLAVGFLLGLYAGSKSFREKANSFLHVGKKDAEDKSEKK